MKGGVNIFNGRALVVGADAPLVGLLEEFGLQVESAAHPGAALLAVCGADAVLDPFQLVLGAGPELALAIDQAALLTRPQLLEVTPELYHRSLLSSAIAPAFQRAAAGEIQLPGIDVVLGLENVAGDRPFDYKLLERFCAAQRDTIARMRLDRASENWAEIGRRAHTLRGSAANIGAREVQQAALRLEQHIKQQGSAGEGQLDALDAALASVIDGLDRHFQVAHDTGGGTGPCEEQARAAQAKLAEMLSDYNGDAIDYFDEARASLASLLAPAALDALAAHLERYEFDAARALLKP